jgi:hypothetical protein
LNFDLYHLLRRLRKVRDIRERDFVRTFLLDREPRIQGSRLSNLRIYLDAACAKQPVARGC